VKIYVVESYTNYGPIIQVVKATSKNQAKKQAMQVGAWDDCTVYQLKENVQGILYDGFDTLNGVIIE